MEKKVTCELEIHISCGTILIVFIAASFVSNFKE